jgi:hypothetical protein
MNNPEKLATYGTLDKEKQNKNTTQYVLQKQCLVCCDLALPDPTYLCVGGLMSYLRYLCLFAYSGVQHILCCVFVLFFLV